jgi:hypothetical protein
MDQAIAIGHISRGVWLRVVLVAAVVALLVAGGISLIDRALVPRSEPADTGSEAGATVTRLDGSCRQLISIPKQGWVCLDR